MQRFTSYADSDLARHAAELERGGLGAFTGVADRGSNLHRLPGARRVYCVRFQLAAAFNGQNRQTVVNNSYSQYLVRDHGHLSWNSVGETSNIILFAMRVVLRTVFEPVAQPVGETFSSAPRRCDRREPGPVI